MMKAMSALRSAIFFFALAMALSLPANLTGQVYAQQVWDQLQAAHEELSSDGGYDLQNYVVGFLGSGEEDVWDFTLASGTDYLIFAVCDTDCGDVDLALKDTGGNEVVSDILTDDVPVLNYSPSSNGIFRLEIDMYQCSVEPCYFGFGIFKRAGKVPAEESVSPVVQEPKFPGRN